MAVRPRDEVSLLRPPHQVALGERDGENLWSTLRQPFRQRRA
jgi:hypothetical protein